MADEKVILHVQLEGEQGGARGGGSGGGGGGGSRGGGGKRRPRAADGDVGWSTGVDASGTRDLSKVVASAIRRLKNDPLIDRVSAAKPLSLREDIPPLRLRSLTHGAIKDAPPIVDKARNEASIKQWTREAERISQLSNIAQAQRARRLGSEISDDPAFGPKTKTGKPDMRYKANREAASKGIKHKPGGASTFARSIRSGMNVRGVSSALSTAGLASGLVGAGVGMAFGGVAIAATAVTAGFALLNRTAEKLAEKLSGLNATVAEAQAMREIDIMQARIRQGNEIGDELADFISAKSEFQQIWIRFETWLIENLLPIGTFIIEALNEILKKIPGVGDLLGDPPGMNQQIMDFLNIDWADELRRTKNLREPAFRFGI